MNLLQARQVRFAYDTAPVLRDIDLALRSGEVVALLGPNGSGKSTLIRCLLAQLPATGDIAWEDKPLAQWRHRELARTVAYLPQSPGFEALDTVRQVIALGRSPYWGAFGLESARDAQVVVEVAKLLGLESLLDRPMDQLSGGQRQRALVGRCLAQQPRAMLLDEPNTFLDLRHQMDLLQLLRSLAHERGVGILMALHDLNVAAAMVDRIILLDGGAVVADGTVSEVLRPELLERVYGVAMERIDREGKHPIVVPMV